MCAIAGTVQITDRKILERMLKPLAHRGPDDTGLFYDDEKKVFLGHQRLSIIDLSHAGHQPMLSADESVAVVFNGEIYNYKELRQDLRKKGYEFRSASDTEVLVHGYAAYGADIFTKLDGMWAIALYDKKENRLYLSRDPAGIKPLYFYKGGGSLLFASEIGALADVVPQLHIEKSSLKKFLVHGYIYGTDTIYKEIQEVQPATTHMFFFPGLEGTSKAHYRPAKRPAPETLEQGVAQFKELFARSVRATLQADVPVGLFLSGGIDSALVGYEANRAGARLQAFTIGFEDKAFDESEMASRIAQHLGFPHKSLIMRGADVAHDIERILDAFGEPFADTSALPTYYLSKFARAEGYKVALAGDGADELFGGYPTHYLPSLARVYRYTPRALDALLQGAAQALPHSFTKLGNREKLSRFLYAAREPFEAAHAKWKHLFSDTELKQLLTPDAYSGMEGESADFKQFFGIVRKDSPSATEAVAKVDFMTFLTSDCLVKSDITSMQHGLEIRVPFLNKELIDFGWSLPAHMKASPFQTKKLLRAALQQSLPKEITRLPKQGFVPPLALWLTQELKPVMLDLLSQENVAKTGFLHYTYVAELIKDHLEGRQDNVKKLWALMSLVRFYTKESIHG